MTRNRGNETVKGGFYLNTRDLSFKVIDKEGVLPGNEADTYLRVPALAMLVVGPALGAAYVMFLPCIGFAMLLWSIGEKALILAADATEAVMRVIKPTWHPTMAFFSKNRAKAKKSETKEKWAEDVERKLEADEDEEPRA